MSATTTTTKAINPSQLNAELGAGYLLLSGTWPADGTVKTLTAGSPVTQQQLNAAVAAHVANFAGVGRRIARSIRAILADLLALPGATQISVWNDVTSGSPPKWQGSNDPVVWSKASQSTLSITEKAVALAFYVKENPNYLLGMGVNVPGDQPEV